MAGETTDAQAAFLVRNRVNQRRSRARRKDYIQDLERRVHDFQQKGVQATAEVQSAARKVAEENRRLRTLLQLRGVGASEIDEFLRDDHIIAPCKRGEISPFRLKPTDMSTNDAGPNQSRPVYVLSEAVSPVITLPSRELQAPAVSSDPFQLHAMKEVAEADAPHLSKEGTCATPFYIPTSQTSTRSGSVAGRFNHLPSPPSSADETSCQMAASIIAGMRGNQDVEEVWPELGCDRNHICVVKNVDLFQMMDR